MNQTTRTYPRTMEQAFGPYHRGNIWEPVPKMDKSDRIVMVACAIVTASMLAMAAIGWLA